MMADFCKQCSLDIFGEDFGELANLGPVPEAYYAVLCEGCVEAVVNIKGECRSHTCLKKHGLTQLFTPLLSDPKSIPS
jgi:hypothetical protein